VEVVRSLRNEGYQHLFWRRAHEKGVMLCLASRAEPHECWMFLFGEQDLWTFNLVFWLLRGAEAEAISF